MIMPGIFTFGIPNYFKFTFQAGPKSPSRANGTVNVESSHSNVTADLEADNKTDTPVPSPLHGTGNSASSPCGTLNKLPLELRIMVYVSILKFEKHIKQAHRFLGHRPPIMAEDGIHIEAIDATLLRTCKTIYREAIPVLYAMNRFHFRNPRDIESFAHFRMGNIPFGFHLTNGEASTAVPKPCGRLTMIRIMTLKIGPEILGDDRKKIWSLWCDFFYPFELDQMVGFPALESLALDLKDWRLGTGDASKIRVRPIFSHYSRQRYLYSLYGGRLGRVLVPEARF